ncbi:MAG: aminopeptidase [Okeania sp. SIO3B3]|nr:aminopeptidase [Okeania sp. SIO3B3]
MFDKMTLEKYADVLLWGLTVSRKVPFKNGETVGVRFNVDALDLAEVVYAKLIQKHLNPVVRMLPTPNMDLALYDHSSPLQLTSVPAGEKEFAQELGGMISILAPASLRHLGHVDPELFGMFQKSRKFLRDIMDEREGQGLFGWTLCLYPTEALARNAGASLEEYAKRIERACLLTEAEPEKDWQRLWKKAQEIKAWLAGMDIRKYRVESENMDLTVGHGEKRRWVGITGHNIPSFELYISPDWRQTEGTYFADLPSFRSGNLVKGVKLKFNKGLVIDADAEQGREFVLKQIAMDLGASRVGEFSLTDKRFSRIDAFMAHTLFDENFGGENGNCHLALGSSYADTFDGDPAELTQERKEALGFNGSALHWDLVNTEAKTVTAILGDGSSKVIYEYGQFAC